MADPRVYFASERTLLAWVRSGLTVIGLGFVVAKFGLFLNTLSATTGGPAVPHTHWPSSALGIALVLLGVATILGALQNHRIFVRTLSAGDRPEQSLPWLSSLLTLAAAAVGALLAVYLLVA